MLENKNGKTRSRRNLIPLNLNFVKNHYKLWTKLKKENLLNYRLKKI